LTEIGGLVYQTEWPQQPGIGDVTDFSTAPREPVNPNKPINKKQTTVCKPEPRTDLKVVLNLAATAGGTRLIVSIL
jgi:hypothetical protein